MAQLDRGDCVNRLRQVGVVRLAIAGVGIALILVGAVYALTWVAPAQYPVIVVWLVAALVIHDGVLAPIVVAFGVLGRGTAARMGVGATSVARAALVVAACCSLVAIPGIAVSALGARNDTIHSSNYLVVLAALWAVAIVISGVAVWIGLRRTQVRARTK
jgi:hypothetical protein